MTRKEINKVLIERKYPVSVDEILDAARSEIFGLENPGFCILCGEQSDSCEPDARYYKCEQCDELSVFGAAELMFYVVA